MSLSTCCPVTFFLPLWWNSCDTDSDEGMNMIDSDQHESSRKDHPGVEILCQVVRRSSAMHMYTVVPGVSLIPTPFVLVGGPVDNINDSTDREL